MRDHTYLPGNFCTLYRPPKERIREMVNRLNYDPIERREQLILTDNPEGILFGNSTINILIILIFINISMLLLSICVIFVK